MFAATLDSMFVLDADGVVHPLAARSAGGTTLVATTTKPEITDPDTGALRVRTQVKPDSAYELFVWKGGVWTPVGRIERSENGHAFEGLLGDGLYWLVEDGSEKLERIFTVDGGAQVFW